MLGDFRQLERSVAKMTYDRRTRDAFRDEVFVAIGRHRGASPMKVAQACIQERANRLNKRNRFGWARNPKEPGKFVFVDSEGCVITGLDAKEIASARRVGMPELVTNRSVEKIIDAAKEFIKMGEGTTSFIYLDTSKPRKPTVGNGHQIRDEADLLAIHERIRFYRREESGAVLDRGA